MKNIVDYYLEKLECKVWEKLQMFEDYYIPNEELYEEALNETIEYFNNLEKTYVVKTCNQVQNLLSNKLEFLKMIYDYIKED